MLNDYNVNLNVRRESMADDLFILIDKGCTGYISFKEYVEFVELTEAWNLNIYLCKKEEI
jgi:hypothetical protein